MTYFLDSFVFGMVSSTHCAVMCGPLALTFGGGLPASSTYQLGRIGSYAAIGAALGVTGTAVGSDQIGTPSAWIAFTLAAAVVFLTMFGERGAVRLPGVGRLMAAAMAFGRRLSPPGRGLVMGSVTPLLPCGVLWAACAGAALAGSAAAGTVVMTGFAAGSLPLLLLTQSRAHTLTRWLSPRALSHVQRVAMLSAAALLVWRGAHALTGAPCH